MSSSSCGFGFACVTLVVVACMTYLSTVKMPFTAANMNAVGQQATHRGLGTVNQIKQWHWCDDNGKQAQSAQSEMNSVGDISSGIRLGDDDLQLDMREASHLQHIIVTGGAGYIGSHAAIRLLDDAQYSVTILDNLSRGNLEAIVSLRAAGGGRLAFYNVDLGDPVSVSARIATIHALHPVYAVIHFAGIAYVAESYANPTLYYRNVTANTANLINAMENAGIQNIIFSSTCATYGNAKKMPITEQTPQIPVSPYGSSKLMTERIILDHLDAHPHFSAVILRYFNVIGADPQGRVGETPRPNLDSRYSRISQACFDVALGKRKHFTIAGANHPTKDGTCVRDYVHVMDLVDAHVKAFAVFKPGESTTLNIGTGTGYSVREFASACRAATGKNISIVEGPGRDGDAAAVNADPSKAIKVLKWRPKYTVLRDTLKVAWRWALKHQQEAKV